MGFSTLVFFLITLALGAGVGYFLFKQFGRSGQNANKTTISSTVLLEKIEKVFKVVMSEGYFTEIFDYKDEQKFLYLFKNSKKALVIAKSKVLVGFDFAKMQYHFDETTRKMVVTAFPAPEVLSIDTDYKFYDVENGWLNRFNQEDYTQLLSDAKASMQDKAMHSDLPRIANNQVQFMMYQLASSMGWKIDLQLPEGSQATVDNFNNYELLDAAPKQLSNK